MKKNIFLLLVAILTISSCKTKEKIIYFQDITPDSVATTVIPTQQSVLKLVPGDKIGITVTSAATPELAVRYNLSTGSSYSSTSNADNMRYTIDENGNVDLSSMYGRDNDWRWALNADFKYWFPVSALEAFTCK